ncbi:23S rRNA (pseudouridine(1915)-N(3))-methyltransferase RlmH [Sphingomonas antarctica]|uniref:23S rRNA (pseudouridine(1915)-N(3))-methyltransferase RlmH n=1 Tax=Sphingomonas antarctica TaxID=2040274 RepID=UPI0039EBEE01
MRLHIVAHGRIGRCPEAELIERYAKRMSWPLAVTELPDTGGESPPVAPGTRIIALDEAGETLGSVQLAQKLETWRDAGIREVRFLIGAADGLTEEERASADLKLSFGRLTWPHMLARAMLVEQLYRATAIIAGHPYHREG